METPTKKRILIADDDVLILESMEKALTDAGYDVVTVTSGEQAIETVATREIDLAILDYRMPGFNGLETGREIYRLTSTRFVMMSKLFNDRDLVLQASKDGALEFLAKPPRLRELLNTVTVCTERAAELKSKEKSLKELQDNYTQAVSRGIASARSVNTAIGILMARHQKNRADAHTILMRLVCNEHRRAVEISEEIIQSVEKEHSKKEFPL